MSILIIDAFLLCFSTCTSSPAGVKIPYSAAIEGDIERSVYGYVCSGQPTGIVRLPVEIRHGEGRPLLMQR